MSKIKKHIKEHGDYHIYETEDGKTGLVKKTEDIYVGDMVQVEKILVNHPLHDLANKIELATLDISWIFSKI